MILKRIAYRPSFGPILLENKTTDEVLVLEVGKFEYVTKVENDTGTMLSSTGMIDGIVQEEPLPDNADMVVIKEVIPCNVVGALATIRVIFQGKQYKTSPLSFV